MTRTLTLLALLGALPAFAITGREVIATAQQRHGFSTWRDRTSSATLENYDKDTLTRTRELDISEQTDPRRSQRSFTEFTAPTDVKGTLFLHLSPRGAKDEQWIWTPATRRARRLAEAKEDENFFGSDLTYRDLELLVRIQQWDDAEATATLAGEEDLDGKPCYVVELVPRNEEFPYPRYRLWFARDDYLLWRLDVYGAGGKEVLKRRPWWPMCRRERTRSSTCATCATTRAFPMTCSGWPISRRVGSRIGHGARGDTQGGNPRPGGPARLDARYRCRARGSAVGRR